jgi:predicted alpha/beta hydrolase family esterase
VPIDSARRFIGLGCDVGEHTNPGARRLRSPVMSRRHPHVESYGSRSGVRAVVLVLHGGRADSVAPARRGLAYLRVLPFVWAILRATGGTGTAVWLLRYRFRGWNGPEMHPVADAEWALDEARRRHPGAPVVLVGHSMGGRTALRLAGAPGVVGVCALAPWIQLGEPRPRMSGAQVVIAHGDHDRITDPGLSQAYAAVTGAHFSVVAGDNHSMLRHWPTWNRLVTTFVTRVLTPARTDRR